MPGNAGHPPSAHPSSSGRGTRGDSFLQVQQNPRGHLDPLESRLSLESARSDEFGPVVQYNPYPFVGDASSESIQRRSFESLSSSSGGRDPFRFPSSHCDQACTPDTPGFEKGISPSQSSFSVASTWDLRKPYLLPGQYGPPSSTRRSTAPSTKQDLMMEGIPSSPARLPDQDNRSIGESSLPPPTAHGGAAVPDQNLAIEEKSAQSPKRRERAQHRGHFMSSYRYLPSGSLFRVLLPAILVSLIRGLATPAMTKLLGEVSDAMAEFNGRASQEALDALNPPPSPAVRAAIRAAAGAQLNAGVRVVCAIFAGIAFAVIVLGVVGTTLWLQAGEHVGQSLRLLSFDALTRKPMSWYDEQTAGLSAEQDKTNEKKGGKEKSEPSGPPGAGGMMTRFVRDTDEVRLAAGAPMGQAFQQASTIIACLVLALVSSWKLTLVVLCSVPLNMLLTAFTLQLGAPWILKERAMVEKASGHVERTVSAISTIKAFNAQQVEADRFNGLLIRTRQIYLRSTLIWSVRFGLTALFTFSMFVQGFWYGTSLVESGALSPGKVMTVFWAALMASTRVGSLLQVIGTIHQGQIALRRIEAWFEREPGSYDPAASAGGGVDPSRARRFSQAGRSGASVVFAGSPAPTLCLGKIRFHNVSFRYPTRPESLALETATIQIPSGQTTYLVGGSGSGKSTIASLLLGLYVPEQGHVSLDDRPLSSLPSQFLRNNIAAVTQVPVVFSMSIRDNIALGASSGTSGGDAWKIQAVPQDRIEAAARIALLHDFVMDLPQDYDTLVGVGGVTLSGGQGQRLALARAVLCNPSVLILDEATSALDVASRSLVHAAMARSRQGRTTLVITHDMSQVEGEENIFVLDKGKVVEHGAWEELVALPNGICARFASAACQDGPSSPVVIVPDVLPPSFLSLDEEQDEANDEVDDEYGVTKHDVDVWSWGLGMYQSRYANNRNSLWIRPNAPRRQSMAPPLSLVRVESEGQWGAHSSEPYDMLHDVGSLSRSRRSFAALRRRREFVATVPTIYEHGANMGESQMAPSTPTHTSTTAPQPKDPSVLASIKLAIRQTPNKVLLSFGLVATLVDGLAAPSFSVILGRLMAAMGSGLPISHSFILTMSMALLGLAFARGLGTFARYMLLESAADEWVMVRRLQAYRAILSQHKSWFDTSPLASSQRITTCIAKDGEDARKLIAFALGELLSSATLMVGSLVLSFVFGWQLTLVGLGFGLLFVTLFGWNAQVLAQCEARNKLLREECAKGLFLLVSHIRAIRSMALEPVFGSLFNEAVVKAHKDAVRAAPLNGLGGGAAEGMQYLAEAGIYGVACFLLARGTYTLTQVTTTLNVLLFAVSFAGQGAMYIPLLSKSARAQIDLERFGSLPLDAGPEAEGELTPTNIRGSIEMQDVHFSYPSTPDVPVLTGVNLRIEPGESVAIVGSSGCGKSTLAALLQRLYEPTGGSICFDGTRSNTISVNFLRDKLAVVSQSPDLFPGTIEENIAYGSAHLEPSGKGWALVPATGTDLAQAAQKALVLNFASELPAGLKTTVGEHQAALSGGQAQRVALARMLARAKAKVRVLDECTAALDPATQAGVMDALLPRSSAMEMGAVAKPATVVVTHKVNIMRRCDRVIVLKHGRVVEHGPFDTLLGRDGALAHLVGSNETDE